MDPAQSRQEQRVRSFFNLATFIGGLSCIPQAVIALPYDPLASAGMVIWGLICAGSLFLISKGRFKLGRFLVYFTLIVIGGLVAARTGYESGTLVVSFALLVSIFITHKVKEWRWVVLYMCIHAVMVFLVNTNALKLEIAPAEHADMMRSFNFIGTMVFVYLEIRFLLSILQESDADMERELREKNKDLEVRYKEKSIMLQEIHHRVKNNLQIITSLLRLQSREIDDPHSKEVFKEAISRVTAMGLLHEKIYQAPDLTHLDMDEYLSTLARELIDSYKVDKPVKVHTMCEVTHLSNQSIVPVALIFNELLSNSLKHGMQERSSGEIMVRMRSHGDQEFSLHYSDNGQWMDPQSEGFGMELIQALTDQLSGKMEREVDELGTHFRFELKDLN